MFDYEARREELSNYTVRELRQMCIHSYGISGVSKLRKNEIIDKILEYEARREEISELDFEGSSKVVSEQPRQLSTSIYVSCGASSGRFPGLVGRKVSEVSNFLEEALNIDLDSVPFVNGEEVSMDYVLKEGDTVEFVKRAGRKGSIVRK